MRSRRRRQSRRGRHRADRHGHALARTATSALTYTGTWSNVTLSLGQRRTPAPLDALGFDGHVHDDRPRDRDRRPARPAQRQGQGLRRRGLQVDDRPVSVELPVQGRGVQHVLERRRDPLGQAGRRRDLAAGRGSTSTRSPSCARRRLGADAGLSCRGRSSSRTAPGAAGRGSCAPRRSRAGRSRAS